MLAPGTLLAGKYRIDRVIGEGGMGTVVAATHVYLSQPVALKFLLPEFLEDDTTVERFLREARASAALRGEHVCRVFDVGTLESGSPFIVMELLDGADLASTLGRGGPLPVELASQYVLQACVGLAEAHGMGIIHRDLKPANLFVTRRPDGTPLVKVLDFGIAKAERDASFQLTRTASVIGSPGYMSPEQLRSARDADARSDIWALGVILYELASGKPPFVAESITELALKVAMDPLPPLTVPSAAGFDRVVARCLEKDPAQRFQDVGALAQALAPFAGPRAAELASGAARVLGPASPASPAHAVALPGVPTTLGGSAGAAMSGRRTVRWSVVAAAAAVTGAAIVAIALHTGGAPAARPAGAMPAGAEPTPAAPPALPAAPAAPPAASTAAPAAMSPTMSAEAKPPAPVAPAPPVAAAPPASTPAAADTTAATTAPTGGTSAAGKPRPPHKAKPPPPPSPHDDVGASRF